MSKDDSETAFMELQLTHRCQLNCKYCELEKKRPDMTEELMCRGIDFLFTTKKKGIRLQFFGGEPLLKWNLIKKAVGYIHGINKAAQKNVHLLISTNALLINDEMLEYFMTNDMEIVFSLDGSSSTHIFNRPAGRKGKRANEKLYDRAVINLKLLQGYGVNYFVNFVIDPGRVKCLVEDTLFLVKTLRVEKLRLSYRLGHKWKPGEKRIYFKEIKKVTEELAGLEGRSEPPRVDILNYYATDEPTISATSVVLDSDGVLYYGCVLTMRKSLPGLKHVNRIGNLSDLSGYDEIERDQGRLTEKLINTTYLKKKEKEIVLNNIEFGIENRKFYDSLKIH